MSDLDPTGKILAGVAAASVGIGYALRSLYALMVREGSKTRADRDLAESIRAIDAKLTRLTETTDKLVFHSTENSRRLSDVEVAVAELKGLSSGRRST